MTFYVLGTTIADAEEYLRTHPRDGAVPISPWSFNHRRKHPATGFQITPAAADELERPPRPYWVEQSIDRLMRDIRLQERRTAAIDEATTTLIRCGTPTDQAAEAAHQAVEQFALAEPPSAE